jgi:hypothetical protein
MFLCFSVAVVIVKSLHGLAVYRQVELEAKDRHVSARARGPQEPNRKPGLSRVSPV